MQSDSSIAAMPRAKPAGQYLTRVIFKKQGVMRRAIQTKCFTVCALVMLIAISCITRNNPFDPVNQPAAHASGTAVVSDKDTLMTRIFNAMPGDTVVLAAGVFPVSLRFGSSGTASRPIVFKGSDSSVVHAQPGLGILYISGQHSLRFSHLVFDSSFASGVKIENGSSDIAFDNCIFRNNDFDGLEITDSDVRATNCVFLRNKKAGIRISGNATAAYAVAVDNALCAHNAQEGVAVIAAPASIAHSTISDNGASGVAITSPAGAVRVAASIVSFNGAAGISGQWDSTAAHIFLDSLDIFSNQQVITISPTVSSFFWTVDPMFTDRVADIYSIGASGEIYRLEQQGIIIGYRK
jgi:hypothetical protein